MTATVVVIGRCSVCVVTAALVGGGCRRCVARFGARFIRAAARVRSDPSFRALVVAGIRPEHRRFFRDYFASDAEGLPPRTRRSDFEG